MKGAIKCAAPKGTREAGLARKLLADRAGIINRYQGWEKQDKDIRRPFGVCVTLILRKKGQGERCREVPWMDDTNATNGA